MAGFQNPWVPYVFEAAFEWGHKKGRSFLTILPCRDCHKDPWPSSLSMKYQVFLGLRLDCRRGNNSAVASEGGVSVAEGCSL